MGRVNHSAMVEPTATTTLATGEAAVTVADIQEFIQETVDPNIESLISQYQLESYPPAVSPSEMNLGRAIKAAAFAVSKGVAVATAIRGTKLAVIIASGSMRGTWIREALQQIHMLYLVAVSIKSERVFNAAMEAGKLHVASEITEGALTRAHEAAMQQEQHTHEATLKQQSKTEEAAKPTVVIVNQLAGAVRAGIVNASDVGRDVATSLLIKKSAPDIIVEENLEKLKDSDA